MLKQSPKRPGTSSATPGGKKLRWTATEESQLIQAVDQGMTAADIAKEYFSKTRSTKQVNDKISNLKKAGLIKTPGRTSSAPLSVDRNTGNELILVFSLCLFLACI